MSAQEAFLSALDEGVADDRLALALEAVAREQGASALVACLTRWVDRAESAGAPLADVTRLRARLAAAAEAAARETGPEEGPGHAFSALTLYRDVLNDAEGAMRAARLAMTLGSHDVKLLERAAEQVGGYGGAIEILQKGLKDPAVKGDAAQTVAHRRALARLCEMSGDVDRAFFETLKLVRKAPEEPLYVDEAFRLALATEHAAELVVVFDELAGSRELPMRHRATILNKVGHLQERSVGDNRAALTAYLASLALHPESKGARRHAERLSELLGVPFEMPAPAPEPPPAALVPEPPTHEVKRVVDVESATQLDEAPRNSDGEEVLHTVPAPPPGPEETRRDPRPAPISGLLPKQEPRFDDVTVGDPAAPTGLGSTAATRVDATQEGPGVSMTAPPEEPLSISAEAEAEAAAAPSDEPLPSSEEAAELAPAGPPPPPPPENTALEPLPPAAATQESHFTVDAGSEMVVSEEPANAPPPLPPDEDAEDDELDDAAAEATLQDAGDAPSVAAEDAALPPEMSLGSPPDAPPEDRLRIHEEPTDLTGAPPADDEPDAYAVPTLDAQVAIREYARAMHEQIPPEDRPTRVGGPPPRSDDVDAAPPPRSDDLDSAPGGSSEAAPPPFGADDHGDPTDPRAASLTLEKAPPLERTFAPFDEPSLPSGELDLSNTEQPRTRLHVDSSSSEEAETAAAEAPADPVELGLAATDVAVVVEAARTPDIDDEDRLALAARALLLGASRPATEVELDPRAVEIFVAAAPSAPERAVEHALAIKDALPPVARLGASRILLAAAEVSPAEGAALALVDDLAHADAPRGPLFRFVDEKHAAAGRVALRLKLRERALDDADGAPLGQPPLAHDEKRELIEQQIAILEDAGQREEALPRYARLALELDKTPEARRRARKAYESAGAPSDVLWLLGRLARASDGEEQLEILRRLIPLRRRASDLLGAEAAAREILEKAPDDRLALDTLIDLADDDERRRDERQELLRRRLAAARDEAPDVRARISHALAAALLATGKDGQAIDVLRAHLLEQPEDDVALVRARDLLVAARREAEVLDLYEAVAERTSDVGRRAALLLDAAGRARALQKEARAGELCDRALDAEPDHMEALLLRAELAVDIGDAEAALQPLERLAANTPDVKARAKVHFRLGKLLEEHLLRPDDALKRYRAAAQGDPALVEAWDALRSLAGQRRAHALQVEALLGLAELATLPEAKAALLREAAALERDEHVELESAEKLYRRVLELTPDDEEALEAVLALLVARIAGEPDTRAVLEDPSAPLLVEVGAALEPVMRAAASGQVRPSLDTLRLWARAVEARASSEEGAEVRAGATDDEVLAAWDAVLAEKPTDRAALVATAAVLERAAARRTDEERAALDARRQRVLETLLLHHAPDLPLKERVALWADLGALRWDHGDVDGGRKALTQAFELAEGPGLAAAIPTAAARAAAAAFEGPATDDDRRRRIAALRLVGEREEGDAAAESFVRAADVAHDQLKDSVLARKILHDAIERWPKARAPRERLLDLDLAEGDAEAAIATTRGLLEQEIDPRREAELQVRLGKLLKRVKNDTDGAAEAFRRAIELDPTNAAALDGAEALFEESGNAAGLAELYAAQLKTLPRDDVRGRQSLLERLAQVRRYDLRDLRGAVEALEAICSLDDDAIKPREDAARLYAELGNWRGAVQMWRAVLERDPLHQEAWRGLFSVYGRTRQGDEAFAIAAAMVSAEVADPEIAKVVRRVRPPFPRWPKVPKGSDVVRRKIAHDLERAPIRQVLELCGALVHPRIAKPLKSFGLKRKDRLTEKHIPPSIGLAVRTVSDLLGLEATPDLYLAQLVSADGAGPPFALLPANPPGLVVSDEVLAGGMTPERAFALGRAMAWLTPYGLIAGTLGAPEVKALLEALVQLLLPETPVEGDPKEIAPLAKELDDALFGKRSKKAVDELRTPLVSAVRDYAHARGQLQVADWMAGVGYTGDRLGFLLAGDLAPSVRGIKATAAKSQALGARLAIKELVLFSISSSYLLLRRELGLSLSKEEAAPVLELA